MRMTHKVYPTLLLLAAPLVVAVFGLGLWVAVALVATALLWHWVLILRDLQNSNQPELVLETIPASHFVEKVRWCLDRLGIAYEERADVGTLGAFYRGRTVPRLCIRTGAVTSALGESPAILRYLWGRYASEAGERAEFLRPTLAALELEAQIDRYGVWLQQWIYFHILDDRSLSLHIWGVHDKSVPTWQRLAIRVAFPLNRLLMRRVFRLSPATHERAVARIEALLGEIEQRFADGRTTLLDTAGAGFVDYGFAALSGLWVWPEGYGGGRAAAVMPAEERLPEEMRAEIARWRRDFPLTKDFVERLYRDERGT